MGDLDDEQAGRLIGRKKTVNEEFIDLLESDRDFVAAISGPIWNVASIGTRLARIREFVVQVLEAEA